MAAAIEVEVGGRRLKLSNLEKVLYPGTGTTKAQVIDYYTRVAPVLVPHMRGRPLTLKRYPNGVDGKFFYEKNAPSHRPEWVTTAVVSSRSNQADINFCVVEDLPTLVWAANLASLELVERTLQHRPALRVIPLMQGCLALELASQDRVDAEQRRASDHHPRQARLRRYHAGQGLDAATTPQNGDPVRDIEHFAQLVADEDDRQALADEYAQSLEQLL